MLGTEVKAKRRRPGNPVLAVRVSPELLAKLSDHAPIRGITVSDAVRDAIEEMLGGALPTVTGWWYSGADGYSINLDNATPLTFYGRNRTATFTAEEHGEAPPQVRGQ